ncbi:MAG: carboxylesterase family protein [Bacteroidota bacterium]
MSKPIVSLTLGQIQGEWISKGSLASFKGIPYAKPPVGRLRWKAPQPLEKWEGVKNATKFGPYAWQQEISLPLFLGALVDGQGWNPMRRFFVKSLFKIVPRPKQSEDCLYLNIKTPSLEQEAKLPVMVWIHGGDHQDGGSAEVYYDGTAIPEREVVLVTINYRLGLMGYFAHPALKEESEQGVCGNYGTLDQIAALKWVRDHIEQFGGDPDNVTIFGESAGGESVLHMLTSPLAHGLFHKAIMQSPANAGQMTQQSKAFGYIPSAEDFSMEFSQKMGIQGDNQLEQLRNMPAEELMGRLRQEKRLNAFYPIVDGYVLPKSPLEAFRDGDQTKVPLLLGSNADEGTCIYPIFPTPILDYRHLNLSKAQLKEQLQTDFGEDLERLFDLYPGLEHHDQRAEIDILGDDFFGSRVRIYAEFASSIGQATYFYMFKRTPPSSSQTAGAAHASELPFVHGTNTPILPLNEEDQKLSKIMIDYWVSFAKTGDPNLQPYPTWDTFDASNPQWMSFDIDKFGMEAVDRDEKYSILNKRLLSRLSLLEEV